MRAPGTATLHVLAVTCVAAGLLAGCGLGAGSTPAGVRLDITRAFGAQPMRALDHPKVHGQETAMSLLMRNATVSTRYGGGFVESIDGRSGGYEGGQPVDWFYYVDGVLAARGAAETNVRSGERIWWDLHDWSQSEGVPAVVGSFPEPFLHGLEGRRLSVRVECARVGGTGYAPATGARATGEQAAGDAPGGEAASCRAVASRLRAAGVRSTLVPLGSGGGAGALRVLVGAWSRLRADQGARQLESGPGASGVYARVARGGGAIELLDAQGAITRTLGAGAGLVAATRYGEAPPEWLVTGTDAAGVARAASALRESILNGRFAVALTGGATDAAATALALPQPGP